MPISMTQNTPIYTLPGEGKKHAWIFWNKTGQPIYDLWIKTGVGASPHSSVGRRQEGKPPLIRKVELSKTTNDKLYILRKLKVERKPFVKLFGPAALRMDNIIGEKDRDAFLSFVRSSKDNREINRVLDDVGSHLWTVWQWMEEYTKNKGVGQLAKPEEQFTVTVQFDKKFGPGQWVEFIPIDLNGFTINSSNRPDERAGSNTAILLPLEPRSKVEDRDKLDKKRKKKLSDE